MEENRKENIKNAPVHAGDDTQTPHKRRVRYKGKYPKNLRKNIRSCSQKNIKRRLSISFKRETPQREHIDQSVWKKFYLS